MRERRASPWLPPVLLLAVAAASWILYDRGPPDVARRVIVLYAASLVAGPSLVYPWMRARGASTGTAVAGALVVPFAWIAKEGYRITAVFTFWEAVYYALNPLALGLYLGVAAQISLWELAWRRPWSEGWRSATGPAVGLGAVALVAGALVLAGRESGGAEIFYTYVAIHGRLFGE